MEKQMQVTLSPDVYSETEKLRAAYALNMCNVSVSQIVDYKDAYILDQEYDAILNNLNLEQIPKDDALLRILVELLNSITFFRIQDKKKACIEQEYQTKTKAAIWSAIPSLSMIVASGNPIVIAYSLATQVGIGYMNYRKEKARTSSEKSERETELEITAIEQFNALRRELFTTAWRLADKYQFPDRYRLTEKQISQYNAILMDGNEMRKYARMEAIQDKFEAYPQFWYQMGHTAAYIAQSDEFVLEEEDRAFYKQKAVGLFEKFFDLNRFNILREDHIAASAALEYADLLLLEAPRDPEVKKKVLKRLDETIGMAGNANDILQLYAISYLKCGSIDQASKLLKYLVNEEYNTLTNAKILSRLYASKFRASDFNEQYKIRAEYNTLALRVDSQYLFPLPKATIDSDAALMAVYMRQQKSILTSEYRSAIKSYAKKCNDEYKQQSAKANYCKMDVFELLNNTISGLDQLSIFSKYIKKELLIDPIRLEIYTNASNLTKIQYKSFTGAFFRKLAEVLTREIDSMTQPSEIEDAYLDLVSFCNAERILSPASEGRTGLNLEPDASKPLSPYFDQEKMLGGKYEKPYELDQKRMKMKYEIGKVQSDPHTLLKNSASQTALLTPGIAGFEKYFSRNGMQKWRSEVLLVIDDLTNKDCDLWLTYSGCVVISRNCIGTLMPYKNVPESVAKECCLEIDWPEIYDNREVDYYKLRDLLNALYKIDKGEIK